jgi:glucosamine--fructose-6-phosphate aminotransferase (isomerizing)
MDMRKTISLMASEIWEQPGAIERTLTRLTAQCDEILGLRDKHFRAVMFIARGTSDHVADYGQYIFPIAAGLLATSSSPSLAVAYHAQLSLDGVLAIAISQSGSTEEIIETAHWARSLGATTVGITNMAGSALAAEVDLALVTQAGTELAVPATKTYTSALATVAFLAATLGGDQKLLNALSESPALVQSVLEANWDLEGAAKLFDDASTAVIAGRGFSGGVAREIALKLKETSAINAIGLSVADLAHGPIAALLPELPVVCVSPGRASPVAAGIREMARHAQLTGCRRVSIGDDDELSTFSKVHCAIPPMREEIAPLALIVPGQLLAERVAQRHGKNPDMPIGLHKVTQTM